MTMYKKIAVALSAVMLIAASSAVADDGGRGREIVDKALNLKKPDFSHSMIKMALIAKGGKVEETRGIEQYGRHIAATDTEEVAMLFRQSTNKSNQGIGFLQKENKGRDDDKWIYMPALKSTRRVNSSDGSKSFTGTDASYDDMSTREIDDDTHELMAEEKKNGYDCYKVKSTPTAATLAKAQYKYRIQWIDKATYVPIYAEMYNKKDGSLEKVLVVNELSNIKGVNGDAYDTPTDTTLTTVKSGHSTRIQAVRNKEGKLNIVLDKPIPESCFTQNFLTSADK